MVKPIYITQPQLPALEDLIPLLQEIWGRRILTNNGPFHKQLEQALCEYLGVEHLSLFANGTLALVAALRALHITGEVITTPFSFVATSHSLLWNNNTPVFVDVDPHTFNLDPALVKASITERTSAILPVHCFGVPCDVDAIESIAAEHNLKVIYDSAHAFGVNCHCGSVLKHGDLSVLSFHATKVFNTFEGGAIICRDKKMKRSIDQLKNFGFANKTDVVAIGINGKMNELQAAVGLLQLQSIDAAIKRRGVIDAFYRSEIAPITGLSCPPPSKALRKNHAYFPILVDNAYPLSRDCLFRKLKQGGVIARRYFYPLITEFPMYRQLQSANRQRLPVADRLAHQVICLPMHPDLSSSDLARIALLLRS